MNRKTSALSTLGGLALAGAGAVTAYWYLVRPWHRAWGATPEEVNRSWPGDDLVTDPKLSATHAVTINAPIDRVWPWIVQIGQGRAGFYSYEFIENSMGLGIHSPDHIVPELQSLKVGDVLPLAPNNFGPLVAILEPNRALVLHGDTRTDKSSPIPGFKPNDFMNVTWSFFVEPIDERTTRFVERFQLDYFATRQNEFYFQGLLEPGAFLMERKMLLGIKSRAEATK